MKCAFCNRPYSPSVGCCDTAAINAALTALRYHTDCNCKEVKDVLQQLEDRIEANQSVTRPGY